MDLKKTKQDDLRIRFANLVKRQKDGLESVCRQFFPWDVYHQQELIQFILLRLWEYLQEHADEDERQWERWCPNIARQVACNYLKSHEYHNSLRLVPLENIIQDVLPNLDDDTAEELERTEEVLRKLDVDDYRLVQLYVAGIPHIQMARQLGISLRKLQYRISEVKLQLKKLSLEQE